MVEYLRLPKFGARSTFCSYAPEIRPLAAVALLLLAVCRMRLKNMKAHATPAGAERPCKRYFRGTTFETP
jgi:hypothetical protein